MKIKATISLILLSLFLLFCLPVQAQYTITWPDYPDIGTASTFTVDTTGSILIDLGPSGAGATWDFTTLDLIGIQFPVEYVDARMTDWSETFPTSDWVLEMRQWLTIEPNLLMPDGSESLMSIDSYQRYDADDNAVYDVGVFTDTPIYSGAFPLTNESQYFPFPLELTTSWIRCSKFGGPAALTLSPGATPLPVILSISDSSSVVVDATGSIALPMGTFDCLRLKIERHLSVVVQYLAWYIPFSQDTFIMYEWHTKDGGLLFQTSSHSGETDPNFTDASTVIRLDYSTVLTAVEDDGSTLPETFSLDPNFPNPFNPSTSFTYRLPETSRIELSIFNILGHRIRVVASSVQSPGIHRAAWDGRNEKGRASPGGLYFYRLTATPLHGGKQIILTRKMLLSK